MSHAIRTRHIAFLVLCVATSLFVSHEPTSARAETTRKSPPTVNRDNAKRLRDYYHAMSKPKPFKLLKGDKWKEHRDELREDVLRSAGLSPLPERIDLDIHQSEPLDHPWCTVTRIWYQLWPNVYSTGLLFVPKQLSDADAATAPAMLCPHGHWENDNAHVDVQKRCLNFARLGYVVFSPVQGHYEDLMLGISNQTLMIWSNLRAMDYLESLPQVDKTRIGVAGASGGGLQSQMLVALDDRIKAATIVGLTCDFREIMFPDSQHCDCNHFPAIMQDTDHPEISTLGMPAALQFLTMNDWTKTFKQNNFPLIERLYTINGHAERVNCTYYDTPHTYDRPKRERTYGWMERWVRGGDSAEPIAEPDETPTFEIEKLLKLSVDVPANKGYRHISKVYAETFPAKLPELTTRDRWQTYRHAAQEALTKLLGTDKTLPRENKPPFGKQPVVILPSKDGGEAIWKQRGPNSPKQLARAGNLVVLPDVRVYGSMLSTGTKNTRGQRRAWQRNGIVWGRPVPGMAVTDLQAVLDGLAKRDDADMSDVTIISRDSPGLAVAAIFTAGLDKRVTAVDADLHGKCFTNRNLPLVSGILRHGDVLHFAALLADRKLTLHNVPEAAGDISWLRQAFTTNENTKGLTVKP